ncbi:hypothetical protein OJ253_509 [Cryptosporidium canis]|uniref:AP2 domain-containing protein n=1 Tax=Cryptosporidium canis TaxID=195482 RepID=A0A9D5DIN3_9CRYT|nr:hypothetical protein OJ253_509 [Cryptosporidium canis]
MEARAIQIYKPVNKNEVRLVYRIKNSAVSGENGRHQKSYSFNKYGEENAWNMARDAFKFINSNNKLPFDFSDPWKARLINKRGRKSLSCNVSPSSDIQGSPIASSKKLASLKSELYEDFTEKGFLGSRGSRNGSPPSISSARYASLKDHYDFDSSSSPVSPQISPNLIYKFENNYSDLEMKNCREDYHLPSSSYLHLLAAAATEIFEKQEVSANAESVEIKSLLHESFKYPRKDSKYNDELEGTGFEASAGKQTQSRDLSQPSFAASSSSPLLSQTLLPEAPKVIPNSEQYYSLANMPLYNVPLYFNNQASSHQYTSALINNMNQYLMLMDPSFPYLASSNTSISKIQVPK